MFAIFGNVLYKTVGEMAEHDHTASIDIQNLVGRFGTGDNSAFFLYKYDTTGICSNKGSESVYAVQGEKNKEIDRTQSIEINATHKHTATISSIGSNTPHNNIPPYISVYMWKRIA